MPSPSTPKSSLLPGAIPSRWRIVAGMTTQPSSETATLDCCSLTGPRKMSKVYVKYFFMLI